MKTWSYRLQGYSGRNMASDALQSANECWMVSPTSDSRDVSNAANNLWYATFLWNLKVEYIPTQVSWLFSQLRSLEVKLLDFHDIKLLFSS